MSTPSMPRSAPPVSICRNARARPISAGRVVNCFIKCEPNSDGRLRGRRLVMFNDSDISVHRHTKAAAGGMIAAAIGDPAVFISVDAKHSCPHGSGPVAAIIDTGFAG